MSSLSIIIDDLRKLADDLSKLDLPGDSKPSAGVSPAPAPEQAPAQPTDSEEAKAPTISDLRDAFAKVIASGKKAQAMALV